MERYTELKLKNDKNMSKGFFIVYFALIVAIVIYFLYIFLDYSIEMGFKYDYK